MVSRLTYGFLDLQIRMGHEEILYLEQDEGV